MNGRPDPDGPTLVQQARAIADGTSRLLATRWHLWALLELIEAQNATIAELQGCIRDVAVDVTKAQDMIGRPFVAGDGSSDYETQ